MALKKEQIFAVILFIGLGLFIQVTQAAQAPSPVSSQNKSLKLLQGQVKEQGRQVSGLKKEVNKLENDLNVGNKRYLNIVEKRRELEVKISMLKNDLLKTQNLLNKKRNKAAKVLTKTVLLRLDKEQSPSQLLSQKVLMDSLVKEMSIIDKDLKNNQSQMTELEKFQAKYLDFTQTERELATFLNELEQKKGSVVESYMDAVDKQKDVESRYSKLKTQFALASAKASKNKNTVGLKFVNPLLDFDKIEHDKKGLTLTYTGRKPVTSSQNGEIVYSGELSTYGNVVMIDHGDDTRSIILGDFIPKATKGAKVKTGDIVGYTAFNSRTQKKSGKVYFEVRKKNKVQNTVQLMDARSLDSGVLAAR